MNTLAKQSAFQTIELLDSWLQHEVRPYFLLCLFKVLYSPLALGDTWLKLPAAYTRRIFANFSSCSTFKGRADVYAKRILTPPYIANIPDTYHHVVNSVDDFIILCSDGLPDLYEEKNPKELADLWVAVVGLALKSRTHQQKQSLSLCLLRDAIGGQDAEAVSRHLTLESEEQWMDDTSIIVQRYK